MGDSRFAQGAFLKSCAKLYSKKEYKIKEWSSSKVKE